MVLHPLVTTALGTWGYFDGARAGAENPALNCDGSYRRVITSTTLTLPVMPTALAFIAGAIGARVPNTLSARADDADGMLTFGSTLGRHSLAAAAGARTKPR
jgi:hypothetical protein